MWRDEYFEYDSERFTLPEAHGDAEAVPGPAPAVLDGGDVATGRRRSPATNGLGLLSFSIMQPLETMAAQVAGLPQAAAEPPRRSRT